MNLHVSSMKLHRDLTIMYKFSIYPTHGVLLEHVQERLPNVAIK